MSLINRQTVMTSYDYYVLAAAATGATINRANDADELKSTLLFGGAIMGAPIAFKAAKGVVWDLPKWGYQNFGNYKNAIGSAWNNAITQPNIIGRQRIAQYGFWDTYRYNEQMAKIRGMNVPQHNFGEIRKMDRAVRAQAAELQAAQNGNILQKAKNRAAVRANEKAATTVSNSYKEYNAYKKVNQLIKEAEGLTGKQLAAKMKEIDKALVEAKVSVNVLKAEGKIVSKTGIGKVCSAIKTKTGIRAVQNSLLKASVSENVAKRMLAKGVRGGGAMAVIGMVLEAPEIYKTYKELGGKAGTKQLLKSGAVVAAETVGWIAGAKIGAIAGAKLGTAIGTVCPGLGNVIGGAIGTVVGFLGGMAVSWLCGKGARALVGKNEREIHAEKQARLAAAQAKKDDLAAIQLADKAAKNVEDGKVVSEQDVNSIAKSYQKLQAKLEKDLQDGKITLADLGIEEEQAQDSTTSENYTNYQIYPQQYQEQYPTNYVEVINENDKGLNALSRLASGTTNNNSTTSIINPFAYTSNYDNQFNPYKFSYVA